MCLFDTDFTNFHRLIREISVKKINHGLLNGLSFKSKSLSLLNCEIYSLENINC
ncbi:hypothetical protein MCETHM1_01462 [Flavobacteriaceae bacterium]